MDSKISGRMGGKARAKALSPERRSEIARKAVKTRWRNARKRKAEQKRAEKGKAA